MAPKAADGGRGFSPGEWPVSGGVESASADAGCSYQELVVTGHEDGSVRFWDASATSMQSLYRYVRNSSNIHLSYNRYCL